MKEILGIIPARYASSRFPGKPLALIMDKPMIQWVFERVSAVIKHLYVATDDIRIKEAVEAFGGKAVMTSTEHRTGTERCREALNIIGSRENIKFTHVINIQGDEPLIHTEQLMQLLNCFDQPEVDISTIIQPFGTDEDLDDPNTVKVAIDIKFRALYFSRSVIPFVRNGSRNEWMKDHPFYKHIGLYAFRAGVLNEITRLQPTPLEQAESLEQLRWIEHGYRIQAAVSNSLSFGVDTPEDLENVRNLLRD